MAGILHWLTTVVAGILQKDGLILICQRRADQPHALKWEFPGGKVEPGEEPAEALTRELREELGIEGRHPVELVRYQFTYPGRNPILLIFFRMPSWTGEVRNLIFNAIAWEPFHILRAYDFLEGDLPFLNIR